VTGHYVESRLLGESGARGLFTPADMARDQSYFLFATKQEQLNFLRFPLGLLSKPETRAVAEELGLTTAELSYLPDRSQAFDNLARRCGHSGVKSVAIALNQAEKYGTPMGQALRITAQENREMRMQSAEQKAAALPAKLTVPMIIFFLPCLFAVIIGPAIIRVMRTLHGS